MDSFGHSAFPTDKGAGRSGRHRGISGVCRPVEIFLRGFLRFRRAFEIFCRTFHGKCGVFLLLPGKRFSLSVLLDVMVRQGHTTCNYLEGHPSNVLLDSNIMFCRMPTHFCGFDREMLGMCRETAGKCRGIFGNCGKIPARFRHHHKKSRNLLHILHRCGEKPAHIDCFGCRRVCWMAWNV
nr:unnamed protein product [uncultured bacterium]